ncbi:MAG: DNA-directed RNA polymerase subunit omega [Bacteroidetes bacterium QS_9_68_14]|nr:MAG: DNA-directed RNA polymerase subunit omega [Bacteroidetes bacterium QS_9_68_14]
MPLETLDVQALAEKTGNLYETVAIAAKRARQNAANEKAELEEKLSYFEGFGPEVEDARMQEEQARTSIEFEERPKPTEVAIEEVQNDEIYHRFPEDGGETEEAPMAEL